MHRSTTELEEMVDHVLAAPSDEGRVEMIVRRPAVDEREMVETAKLDLELGLIGDSWRTRSSRPDPLAQVTLMNSRAAEAVAVTRDRWPLCGDQLYVDMDISVANLPPGTRLAIGQAVIEISTQPHTGCNKFAGRFGREALRFVNVGVGKDNRLRGANTFVVRGGEVGVGDTVEKVSST